MEHSTEDVRVIAVLREELQLIRLQLARREGQREVLTRLLSSLPPPTE